MPPTNKPASPGAFGGFTPVSSWSSKSGTKPPAGMDMSQFFGGANVPAGGSTAQNLQNMMQGTGYKVGSAPSLNMYQQGTLYDLMKSEDVARQTQDRNTRFFDETMANMQAAQKQLNTPSPAFEKAYGFQKQLTDQTAADRAAFDKQAKAAEVKYADQMGRVQGAYNQAMGQIDQGRDKIASEMAAGMRQNYDLQQQQQMGALMAQGISPDQMAEAQRESKYEMERGVGANVSNLQFQGAQAKAGILQAKANAIQGMAGTQANLSTTIAQMGMQSAGAKQEAIKLGAQIAMANAADDQQRNQMVAQYAMNMGQFGVNFLEANPIVGTLLGGTIAALGKQAGLAGQGVVADRSTAMNDRAMKEVQAARSALTGGGYGNYGMNFDIERMIMNGMSVPGVSREVQEWIRQNGMPAQRILGEAGGAGRMGYEEGMAPRGGSQDQMSGDVHTRFGYMNAPPGQRKA